MSTVWIVSMVLAWVVIVLLTVSVVSLLRQFGALKAMLAPAPRVVGAELYDEVAPVAVPTAGGGTTTLAGPVLVVAHSPTCTTGREIEGALAALAGHETGMISALPRAEAAAQAGAVAVDDLPAALRPAVIPAVVGISREGAVCAVGQARTLAELREAADATAGAVLAAGPGSRRVTSWGATTRYWSATRSPAGQAP